MEELRHLPPDRLLWCLFLGILTVLATVAMAEVVEFLFGILRTIVSLCFTSPNRTVGATAPAREN